MGVGIYKFYDNNAMVPVCDFQHWLENTRCYGIITVNMVGLFLYMEILQRLTQYYMLVHFFKK